MNVDPFWFIWSKSPVFILWTGWCLQTFAEAFGLLLAKQQNHLVWLLLALHYTWWCLEGSDLEQMVSKIIRDSDSELQPGLKTQHIFVPYTVWTQVRGSKKSPQITSGSIHSGVRPLEKNVTWTTNTPSFFANQKLPWRPTCCPMHGFRRLCRSFLTVRKGLQCNAFRQRSGVVVVGHPRRRCWKGHLWKLPNRDPWDDGMTVYIP